MSCKGVLSVRIALLAEKAEISFDGQYITEEAIIGKIIYIPIDVYVYICLCVNMCIQIYINAYVHTYIYIYTYTYIHTYI
jgi:copper chaperone CopZ